LFDHRPPICSYSPRFLALAEAFAAFKAISLRLVGVIVFARAFPPRLPISLRYFDMFMFMGDEYTTTVDKLSR
jgi:hypothetical protein